MRGEDFLQKNISGFTQALESILFSEETSRARGLLQGMDARVKTVTLLLFIVTVSLERALPVLAGLYVLTLILATISRIPLGSFAKRGLLFVLFTVLIAIPALFITPGNPLVLFGSTTAITEQGARAAGMLVLRVLDSVSLAALLVLTTPWTRLLVAFRWLRFPSLLVAILGMTYRYIFLLLHTVNSMFLARRSRTVGKLSGGEQRRFLGRALTTTLAKSHHLSEEVYLAMLSRGYRGEMMSLDRFQLKKADLAWGVFSLGMATALIWTNAL